MTDHIKVETEVTFTIVPHWLLDECTPVEIATYIALGKYANNKTKECWPSVSTISKDIKRAKKNTIKALQGLEEKGAIERFERVDEKTGQQTSNLYILRINQVKGGLRKRNRGGNEIVTGGGNENVTRTILNRTISNELYFDTYNKEKQNEYLEIFKLAFSKPKPTRNEYGKMLTSAKQLFEAEIKPEQVPDLVKNMVITYGEKYTTINSITNHTELVNGAKNRSANEVKEIMDQQALSEWANDN